MELTRGIEKAALLHKNFMERMHDHFSIAAYPGYCPIKFLPLFSSGGIALDEEQRLNIKVNDTFLAEPFDRKGFEQTVCHESAHVLHLLSSGFGRERKVNPACFEPVGSIIADIAVLVYFDLENGKASEYFDELSDDAGPAKELFQISLKRGRVGPQNLLREISNQTVSQIYEMVRTCLGREKLYDDTETERAARYLEKR